MSDIADTAGAVPGFVAGAAGSIFSPVGLLGGGVLGAITEAIVGNKDGLGDKLGYNQKTPQQLADEEIARREAEVKAQREDYKSRSKAQAGRGGLNLTDAERTGAGIYAPNMDSTPYPFVTR